MIKYLQFCFIGGFKIIQSQKNLTIYKKESITSYIVNNKLRLKRFIGISTIVAHQRLRRFSSKLNQEDKTTI